VAVALLIAALVVGFVLIPFGLPGLWLMIGAALLYDLAHPEALAGWTLAGMIALGAAAEAAEFALTVRFTRRYGGSRRATFGAIVGSLAGAVVGVPVPVVGSVIGAFVGAFAGAFAAELTRGAATSDAGRVATGALIGRAAAAATKVAVGVALGAWVLGAVIFD
jgi:hypothetical protein